jgi:hypothetical protein
VSDSNYRAAGSKDALVRASPELLHRLPDGVFMYPSFDDEHVCIDAMSNSKERVNI